MLFNLQNFSHICSARAWRLDHFFILGSICCAIYEHQLNGLSMLRGSELYRSFSVHAEVIAHQFDPMIAPLCYNRMMSATFLYRHKSRLSLSRSRWPIVYIDYCFIFQLSIHINRMTHRKNHRVSHSIDLSAAAAPSNLKGATEHKENINKFSTTAAPTSRRL